MEGKKNNVMDYRSPPCMPTHHAALLQHTPGGLRIQRQVSISLKLKWPAPSEIECGPGLIEYQGRGFLCDWLRMDRQWEEPEGQEKPESLWLEKQDGKESAFMEQFVKQLLEELALGRLDICTADVGFRRKGEGMQQEKLPWLAPAVGMLQEANTVGSKDGRKKNIYINI